MLCHMSAVQKQKFWKQCSGSEQSNHIKKFHTTEVAEYLFGGGVIYFNQSKASFFMEQKNSSFLYYILYMK